MNVHHTRNDPEGVEQIRKSTTPLGLRDRGGSLTPHCASLVRGYPYFAPYGADCRSYNRLYKLFLHISNSN